jgi:hypothetical protein
MASYVAILDTQIEPDAPLTATLAAQWRNNVLAIAEGAPGAPRINGQQGPAVNTNGLFNNAVTNPKIANSAVTAAKLANGNNERDWVLDRTAGAAAGVVGSYAFLGSTTGNSNAYGTTRAGSQLFPAGIVATSGWNNLSPTPAGQFRGQNSARAGTWRCMGTMDGIPSGEAGATLWLRIS